MDRREATRRAASFPFLSLLLILPMCRRPTVVRADLVRRGWHNVVSRNQDDTRLALTLG